MPDMNKLKGLLPEGVSVVMIVGALEDSGYSIDPPIITDEGEPVASDERALEGEDSAPEEELVEEDMMAGAAGDGLEGMEPLEVDPDRKFPTGSHGDRMQKLEKAGY